MLNQKITTMQQNINKGYPAQETTSPTIQFDNKSFIGFLMKVSILHESDMDEVNRFSEQINSEDDALYHLSDYFERLGDTEHFENAEKTLESYKNYLLYGEIVDENEGDNQNQQEKSSSYSPIKEQDRQQFHHLHHEPSELNNNSREEEDDREMRELVGNDNSRYSHSQQCSQYSRQRFDQNGQIHERLYQQAFNKQEFQIQMGEIKKEQETKECTFAPKINPINKSKSPYRQHQGSQDVVFNRLSQKKKLSMKEQLSSWQKREELELSKCTFHPQINKQKRDGSQLNISGMYKQPSQEKVFDRLYNRYGVNNEFKKSSQKNQQPGKMSNNSYINSQKNMNNRSSNQLLSQKEKDLLEEEYLITPAKLKNKKDFLKWQSWNQQFDDNSDHQSVNSGSQYQQQLLIQQYNTNQQQNQGVSQQNHSRSITPVKLYEKSASPVSYKQNNENYSTFLGSDSKQVHDRLYNLHFQRLNQKLVKEVENNFMQKKELSFKPEIYTHSYREKQQENQENNKELFQRLYEKAEVFQQKIELKRKEQEDELQQQLKQNIPQINKKSEMIAQNSRNSTQQSAHDRLYENSKQKEKNFEKLKQKVSFEEGCTFKPKTNQYSNKGKKESNGNKNNIQNKQVCQNENNKNVNNFQEQIQNIITKQILKNNSFTSQPRSQGSISYKEQDTVQQDEGKETNSQNNSNRRLSQEYFSHQQSNKNFNQYQGIEQATSPSNISDQQSKQSKLNTPSLNQYEEGYEVQRQIQVQPYSSSSRQALPFNPKKNSFFA